MKKLFTLFALLMTIVIGAKAEITAHDLSVSDYSKNFTSEASATIADGTESWGMYFKGACSITSNKLAFNSSNMKSSNYWISIPLTGIAKGKVIAVSVASSVKIKFTVDEKTDYTASYTNTTNEETVDPISNVVTYNYTMTGDDGNAVLYMGRSGSNVSISSITVKVADPIANPVFTYATGSYYTGLVPSITCETDGATIYYKNADKSSRKDITDTGNISAITGTKTFSSYAMKDGVYSDIVKATYTISSMPSSLTASPAAGQYGTTQNVTFTDELLSNGVIKYTTNGTTPTMSSATYDGTPIAISETTTIKAVVFETTGNGSKKSSTLSFAYTIIPLVNPSFSLDASSIAQNQTAQVKVGDNAGLDGITLSNVNYTTAGIVTVDATTGVVTPSATGTTTITFDTEATDKYNASTGNELTITVTAPITYYAITKTTPENGSIAVSATEAAAGETITLTATPDFKYVLSAWNVYKTGEPETTVTVTDNKFTMPAYAVTVAATFADDTRKQVLYVKANGTIDNTDKVYSALSEDYAVTVAAYDASKTVTDFDLVVLHESIEGKYYNTGLVAAAKSGNVPVLNTKSYFYNSGRWGWGTPNAGKEELGCTIGTAYFNIASHPIFAGITPDADGFITVTTAASSDNKVMQPVGSFVSGKEGYTLATSSNADSGNGTAIHELTPAQRGVEAGKYLLISLHNGCFNKLTADGIKLFKNAAAYLMSDEAWTPEENKSLPLNDGGSSFTKGFTTFCSPVNFTVSEGATAYKAAIADSKLTMTALEGIIPANTGVVIAGNKEGNATITATTAAATADVTDNDLKGTTVEALTADLKGTAAKFLAFKKSTSTFTPYGGTNFPANKAYLLLDSNNNSQSLEMVFEEATGINVVNAAETEAQAAPVKVIKNGKLYIGNYNVAGQQVK